MVAGVRRERSELDRIVIFGDSLSDNGGDHGAQAIVRLATASNVVKSRSSCVIVTRWHTHTDSGPYSSRHQRIPAFILL